MQVFVIVAACRAMGWIMKRFFDQPQVIGEMIAGVILGPSVAAKGLACWAAARATGQDNATAMAVGALMNARGLMGLIIINIGLQKGIIEPALVSMLVVMAIVTTLMASPLFGLVYGKKARASGALGQLNETDHEDLPSATTARPA